MSRPVPFTTFVATTLRVRLTRGQRVVALVVFDGLDPVDLTGADRDVALEIFGGIERIAPMARRILVLLLGRGSGKTTIVSAFALYTLLTADVRRCGPGDVPTFIVVAPDKKTAALSIRMALEMARAVPAIARLIDSETAEGFTLRRPQDGRLVAFECFAVGRAGANVRGRSILGFAIDEAMFLYSDAEGDFVRNDRDVYRALIPRLMPDGRGIFISTPWPVETLMGELFAGNFGHPETATAAKAPTLLMRDHDPELAEQIALERAHDPDNTARERDCDTSIVTGAGMMFDAGAIDRCVDASRPLSALPPAGAVVAAAIDAGFRSDASAIAIVARLSLQGSGARVEHLFAALHLDEVRPERGQPLKPSEVVARFAADLQRYGLRRVACDIHYVEAIRELFAQHKIEIDEAPAGAQGKTETHLHVKRAIHEGRTLIPRHPRLIAQLKSITSRPAPGGGLQISAPRRGGSHGDLASAFVLAMWAAEQRSEPGSVRVYTGGPRHLFGEQLTPAQRAVRGGQGMGW